MSPSDIRWQRVRSVAPTRSAIAAVVLVSSMALAGLAPGHAQDDVTSGGAPAVIVAPVTMDTRTRGRDFVGRVEALREVELKARVEGFLEAIDFEEGGLVETGQVLFEVERGPYEAELAAANASLAVAEAELSAAQAALTQAQQEVDRQTTLVDRDAAPQAVLDMAIARRDEAQARVHSAEAQIARAKANVQTAELHLSYTRIVSPIAGRIGRAAITGGNLVSPQTGALATIVQSDPIRVRFSISERDHLAVAEALLGVSEEGMRGAVVPKLRLADGRQYPHAGEIAFIDNRVDPATGTIAIWAEFPNPDGLLVSGQFVNVAVEEGEAHPVVAIPAGAVLRDRDGPYVLVLDDDDRAQIRRIETAEQTADGVVVTSGLQEGELIVVAGLQRVRPGQIVTPQQADSGS